MRLSAGVAGDVRVSSLRRAMHDHHLTVANATTRLNSDGVKYMPPSIILQTMRRINAQRRGRSGRESDGDAKREDLLLLVQVSLRYISAELGDVVFQLMIDSDSTLMTTLSEKIEKWM